MRHRACALATPFDSNRKQRTVPAGGPTLLSDSSIPKQVRRQCRGDKRTTRTLTGWKNRKMSMRKDEKEKTTKAKRCAEMTWPGLARIFAQRSRPCQARRPVNKVPVLAIATALSTAVSPTAILFLSELRCVQNPSLPTFFAFPSIPRSPRAQMAPCASLS